MKDTAVNNSYRKCFIVGIVSKGRNKVKQGCSTCVLLLYKPIKKKVYVATLKLVGFMWWPLEIRFEIIYLVQRCPIW